MLGTLLEGSGKYFAVCILLGLLLTVVEMIAPQVIRVTVDSVIDSQPMDLPAWALRWVESLGGVAFLRANMWFIALILALAGLVAALLRYGANMFNAKAGETLTLLNGKELPLSTDDLTIADDAGIVGLAGVMGGAKDSVLPSTDKVILEIANFQAAGVRRTALRYDNRTEASSRYEKGIDPERCDQALSLAMSLFRELYPDVRVTSFSDQYPEKLRQAEIDVSLTWLDRRLGKHLTNDEIAHKLGLLGFRLDFSGDNMHVTVPTWRSTGDVSIKADIMEEVARMVGYENFQAAPITTSFDGAINQLDKDLERRIKEYLAIRCGMQEIFTYPWMDESYVNAILQDTAGILALSTPPSPSERLIRSSLLPNLCKAVVKNERYFTEFSLFETAQVFRDADYSAPYDPRELLPSQRKNIAGAFVAPAKDVTALFRRAKGAVEQMPRYTHMEGFTFRQEKRPVWADQVVWLNIFLGEEQVGNLALLARKPAMACGIKNLAVMLFELDVDALKPFRSRTNTFTHLPEYPMTDYDISLLFDSQVKWSQMYDVIAQGIHENGLLHGADFVDEYRGKQVPAGKKSVTIRLTIGSLEKTLTSTEIEECASGVIKKLTKRLGAELMRMKVRPGKHDRLEGEEFLDKVIAIDQSPIGRTPRSNPATYTGLFGDIRELFASTPDAKSRGYGPGRFSFNVKGGRCESCAGDGLLKIEMHFLPDIYVPCEVCKGKRYNRETLEVKYKGKNIHDVLNMTVDEGLEFFANLPKLRRKLETLSSVGLGYLKIGQSSTTLSGGEAQRVKLATELSRRSTGKTIYILDEPTTGLHTYDVHKLLEVLDRLVEGGNTVVVIEHNLDVIKWADHVIDLGPEGGSGGGHIVCTGTPEEVAQCAASYTGQYLKRMLEK